MKGIKLNCLVEVFLPKSPCFFPYVICISEHFVAFTKICYRAKCDEIVFGGPLSYMVLARNVLAHHWNGLLSVVNLTFMNCKQVKPFDIEAYRTASNMKYLLRIKCQSTKECHFSNWMNKKPRPYMTWVFFY